MEINNRKEAYNQKPSLEYETGFPIEGDEECTAKGSKIPTRDRLAAIQGSQERFCRGE